MAAAARPEHPDLGEYNHLISQMRPAVLWAASVPTGIPKEISDLITRSVLDIHTKNVLTGNAYWPKYTALLCMQLGSIGEDGLRRVFAKMSDHELDRVSALCYGFEFRTNCNEQHSRWMLEYANQIDGETAMARLEHGVRFFWRIWLRYKWVLARKKFIQYQLRHMEKEEEKKRDGGGDRGFFASSGQ